jgi:hypothetical protein
MTSLFDDIPVELPEELFTTICAFDSVRITMFLSWKTFAAEIVLDPDTMLDRWV